MSEMNRRHLLFSGIGALALGGVGAMVMARSSRAAGGWEHRFLPVSEMTADGALLVDIRTPKEWQDTGVIEGAELIAIPSCRKSPPRSPTGAISC